MKITMRQLNKLEVTDLSYDVDVTKTSVNLNHKFNIKDVEGNIQWGFYISCVPNGLQIPIPTDNGETVVSLSKEINKFIEDSGRKKFSYSLDMLEELTFEK